MFPVVGGAAAVDKDRTGTSHESFLLMANSQTDMEEWIRAIRRAIWAPLGGGEPPPHIRSFIHTDITIYSNIYIYILSIITMLYIYAITLKEKTHSNG